MKKLLIFLILVGVVLAGGSYWLNHSRSAANGEETFTLAPVEFGTLKETVSATGILQPSEVAAVGSELSGKVVEIYSAAEIGKTVREGEPLLKLDDRAPRNKLEQAQAAVQKAQADVARAKAARDADAKRLAFVREQSQDIQLRSQLEEAELRLQAAEETIKAAEANVAEAVAARKLAQYGLDLTVVRALRPVDGGGNASASDRHYTIIDRKVVLGQLIAPPASAQLFTLASDLGQMQVHAQVSENDISKMRVGLPVSFTVYAYSEDDVRFGGKVVEIRPMPTNLHGAVFYDTIIDVKNERDPRTKEWKLRPGMTAAVDIILREHKNVWKVPTAALSFQLDEHYQTEAARAKLASWQGKNQHDEWRQVWVLDSHGKPWPIWVRIGGTTAGAETGIADGQYNEVLDWDPELEPKPEPRSPDRIQVITGAPPTTKKGFFDRPNIKLL